MCAWRPNNEIQTQRHDQLRQLLYILNKETINRRGTDSTKKTYVWELNLVRNSKQHLG